MDSEVLVIGLLCFIIGFLLHEHYVNWRNKGKVKE